MPSHTLSISPQGTPQNTPEGSKEPSGTRDLWKRLINSWKMNPNHSFVYGPSLGVVGGPDPYLYNPESPEVQQRPPEGFTMREFLHPMDCFLTFQLPSAQIPSQGYEQGGVFGLQKLVS